MAIFGVLTEFSLPQVIFLVGRRTGHLHLREVPGCASLEIHFLEGQVCGLVVGDQLTENAFEMRAHLGRVVGQRVGQFEFRKTPAEAIRGRLRLSLTQFTICLACSVEDTRVVREHFPHPQSRFRLRFVLQEGTDLWLDDELCRFVEQAQPFLALGADAQTLSTVLGMTLEWVQFNFYKLRTVDFITPVRAYRAPFEDQDSPGALPQAGMPARGLAAPHSPPVRNPGVPARRANRLSIWGAPPAETNHQPNPGWNESWLPQPVKVPEIPRPAPALLPAAPGPREPGMIRRLLRSLTGRDGTLPGA